MSNFTTITELIEALYRERKVIDYLFKKRHRTVLVDNLLSFVDYNNDKIEYLIEQSILIKTGNVIELNDELKDFFEKFSNATEEINNEYTTGLLSELKTKISIFSEEKRAGKKDKYLKGITSNLRKIGANILQNLNQIRANIEDVYTTEKNYKIKKIKLDEYRYKTNQIEGLMNSVTALISSTEWEFFVKMADNNTLIYTSTALQNNVKTAWVNLNDITQKIIDYHNQIRLQSATYKKLQKIKRLKDKHLLTENTNIEAVLESKNSLFFVEQQRFSYYLSIPYLQSDEAYPLLLKANQKYKKGKVPKKANVADEISDDQIVTKSKKVKKTSLAQLRRLFLAQDNELFGFILYHDFDYEINFGEKVTLFCKMASLYADEFVFTGNFKILENIEYAVITAKSN